MEVDASTGQALMAAIEANPDLELTIDVESLTVSAPAVGIEATFPLDPFTQHRLLEGLDDVGLTLQHEPDISSYESRRPAWMPSL